MAKRGRPNKSEEVVKIEALYKDLAAIKKKVDLALTHVGTMREVDLFSEAIFKAGRAYGPLDEANDKLEEMLDNMYDTYDFTHYDDIF